MGDSRIFFLSVYWSITALFSQYVILQYGCQLQCSLLAQKSAKFFSAFSHRYFANSGVFSPAKNRRFCFLPKTVDSCGSHFTLEMATAPRTRPRTVVGAPRRAAWQLKSVLRHSVSAAPRTIIFYIFFTIIAGKLFLYVQQWLVWMQL